MFQQGIGRVSQVFVWEWARTSRILCHSKRENPWLHCRTLNRKSLLIRVMLAAYLGTEPQTLTTSIHQKNNTRNPLPLCFFYFSLLLLHSPSMDPTRAFVKSVKRVVVKVSISFNRITTTTYCVSYTGNRGYLENNSSCF